MTDRERNELDVLVKEIESDLATIEAKLRARGRRRLLHDVVLARTTMSSTEAVALLDAGRCRACA